MSFKEKLRKTRIALGTGLLGLAAVAAPVKGQGHAAEPTNTNAVTATASDAATQRKQKFEAAVRSGASKTEIAKYIDFPEFIPVTKEGRFDKTKAEEWSRVLAPYLKVLAEKGETVDAVDAYKAFKETIGQKDVSLEDFKAVQEMAEKVQKDQKYNKINSKINSVMMWGMFAVAVMFGVGAIKRREDEGEMKYGIAMAGLASICSLFVYEKSVDLRTPEDSAYRVYECMYDAHVDKTIKDQQEQFKQTEKWSQVNETLKKSR